VTRLLGVRALVTHLLRRAGRQGGTRV
jgi:hypothetical protein